MDGSYSFLNKKLLNDMKSESFKMHEDLALNYDNKEKTRNDNGNNYVSFDGKSTKLVKIQNDKKDVKQATLNSDIADSTVDISKNRHFEQELKLKNNSDHRIEKISDKKIFDENFYNNSNIKNNHYNINNINNNLRNVDKMRIEKNCSLITKNDLNKDIKTKCKKDKPNKIDNGNKNSYYKFQNEEASFEDSALNQSILIINQKQNNYLKTLFEKTIIKKDQYSNHKTKKLSLTIMLFYIIIYFFCCCTLLIANCQPPETIDSKYNVPFHMLDFWGSFGFALIEAAILVTADMVEIGSIRYFIVAINIGTTLIAAVLFSFNPEFWEITCHWIEFSAQIFITLSDILFIFHQFKKAETNILYKYRYYELALVLLFAMAAVIKLLVFGEVIKLGIDPEKAAHFFEYCGEMINAIFAFIFTLVMYKDCNQNLNAIFDFNECKEKSEGYESELCQD